jgi:UPF0716 protein FxsA
MYAAGRIKSIGPPGNAPRARPAETEFGMTRLLAAGLILAEIASLIIVGRAFGVLLTLLLVVLAALLGAALLRRQGSDALAGMRGALNRGRDPRPALLRGGFRLAAALLLIFPGFVGDVVALLLLLPPVQDLIARRFKGRNTGFVVTERFRAGQYPSGPSATSPSPMSPRHDPPRDRVIDEAEWEEVAPSKRPTHRPSGWTRH